MERGELKERMSALAETAEKRKRIARLKRDTLKKTAFLRRKAIIEPRDVYHLIKEFFKAFLEKPYEFTIGELRTELRSVYISNATRTKLDGIFKNLHAIEYADITLTHTDLAALLDQFADVVEQLVRVHTKPKSLLARVRSFLFKETVDPELIIAELPVIENENPTYVRMHTLIEKCYAALDRHSFHRAKAGYQALVNQYGLLTDEEKQEYYPLLNQTYRDIMNRTGK